MPFPQLTTKAKNPLEGLTPKQLLACALKFGDAIPRTYSQIAERFGISRTAAYKLVRKGLAHIEANGYDVNILRARARAA